MIGHVKYGSGPNRVLMLHGWFTDHTVYEPVLPFLPLDEMTVLLLDQRGYGLSRDASGPYDVATVAQDAATLADRLGWDDYTVIGHSMGGKAALRLALDRPANVSAVVAITPVWAGRVPFDDATAGLFGSAAESADARRMILSHSTSGRHREDWYEKQVQHSFATSTIEAFRAYFQSWSTDDFEEEACRLGLPIHILAGELDQGIPEAAIRATWLAALPDAVLHLLDDVGHYPMLEKASATGKLLASLVRA